ncbi:S-adenosyl-L-methionine-dependent methyltransferase [Naematelia encephala]|uniref:S-adenosyl-L-methionine-dependent methyltransferase n=1 Tax=Naematelia encephala TaxID=71784 RepID=A0A1Y2BBI3_9TREE|nr:S-adenosyl-L-methionine-dependent methyltransferase [Naematelia encephala]
MATANYSDSLTNHTANNYNKHADFVYSDKFTSPIFQLLDAKPGERIIDLGCGTGELTRRIATIVGSSGSVYGIDSSQDMLDTASKTSGENESKIKYQQGDIQDLVKTLDPALKGTFDAVFSSATFHWCKANPGGVLDGIKWLLKPSGRMVWEMGGFGNCVGVRAALHQVVRRQGRDPHILDPWYFPTAEQYSQLLQNHGFTPLHVELIPRPTPLSTDLLGWLQTFARNTFLAEYDDEQAQRLLIEVADICRPDAFWSDDNPGEGVVAAEAGSGAQGWQVMYVRLRGVARPNQ